MRISKTYQFRTITDLPTLGYIFHPIKYLENFYPDFSNWYYDKLVPDILLGNDKVLLMERNHNLIGVSILKDQEEKKLRALRILPQYQKKGLGLYLIDKSLEVLGTDKPHCTVAEETFHQYSRIFVNRYNFNLTSVEKGLYRKAKLEYFFN